MLRRLFACLALLTGLAAAGAPAQAHGAEAQITRIEAGLYETARDHAATATAQYRPDASDFGHRLPDRLMPVATTLLAPPVFLGSDRARE